MKTFSAVCVIAVLTTVAANGFAASRLSLSTGRFGRCCATIA